MNTTTYFKHYHPAEAWAWSISPEGQTWIQNHIRSLKGIMLRHHNNNDFCPIYSIDLNERPLYIGEGRTVQRIVSQAYDLYRQPEIFGLSRGVLENNQNQISVSLLETGIKNKKERTEKKKAFIDMLIPILQPHGPRCIEITYRHTAVSPYLVENQQSEDGGPYDPGSV